MSEPARTVLIAAGGTGGHLFPAAAFADEMRRRGWRVVLMTDARGRRYAQDFPADAIEDVAAATLLGRNPIKLASAAMKIVAGVFAAQKRLKGIDPALVAGFGGYPSFPALWAARAQRRAILIFQADAVLGRVNRYFAPAAAAIACAFERLDRLEPRLRPRKVVTGIPIRAAVRAMREQPYPPLSAEGPINLLVTAGSQGARLFGEAVPAAICALPAAMRARLTISQQVRAEQLEAVRAAYAQAQVRADCQAFFTDMPERLAAAHLVIARAGGSSLTECAVVGRPAILVPLAIGMDDHQTANAEALASVGAADVIQERAFTPEALAALLAQRFSDPEGLARRAAAARAVGKPEAAKSLADLAESLAARR
jgi:UDP-N-acetylglucosamine--N-acetylmuramyl-(pentapeptide) pyrophosphoryl-undecaprenol N-acetylglucosamine transferase